MKNLLRFKFIAMCLLAFSVTVSIAAVSVAMTAELLESKHKGVKCSVCHEKDNPDSPPSSDGACMECHGSHKDVIALTAKKSPNRHQSAHSEMPGFVDPCMNCHNMHKPSVLSCVKCHKDVKPERVP